MSPPRKDAGPTPAQPQPIEPDGSANGASAGTSPAAGGTPIPATGVAQRFDTAPGALMQMGALVLSESGLPWASEADAKQYQLFRKIPAEFQAKPYRSGWALINVAAIQEQERRELEARADDPALSRKDGKFYWVKFHDKRDDNDTQQVYLCVDGKPLLFQRNQPVVVPECFLEAARNARRRHYQPLPGQALQHKGYIMRWPLEVLGPATREEYLASMVTGNQVRDRMLGGPVAA